MRWGAPELAAATELAQAMPEVLAHRAQNRLVRLALHDPLTGLPNRMFLQERLAGMMSRAASPAVPAASPAGPAASPAGPGAADGDPGAAVLFIDVDGFKTVNDTQGHLIGDQLLTLVARRISETIRPQDTVARIGGDEFVLLVPGVDAGTAVDIGQRLVESFRRSFVIGDSIVRSLTLSVGGAMIAPGTDPVDALSQADSAMYHAKRSGRDQVAVFDAASGSAASRRRLARDELSDAITAGEIVPHYQPIFELRSGVTPVLDGFEALARWQHPVRGLVAPDLFIGLAEETGLIDRLGDSMLSQALGQLLVCPNRALMMAVNVSVRQLIRPGYADEVIAALVELGIGPERLCLEVTETQIMEEPEVARAVLTELAAAGVQIAIDDFGIGFSSLAYVRDLPAAMLKIDRLFVSGLPDSSRDLAVVTATIELGHSLGMRTIAEGVETADQLELLRRLGSDFAQGYLLGRPRPAGDIEAMGARDPGRPRIGRPLH